MYVAITKTAKDSVDKRFKGLPPSYPVMCQEFETEEQAKELCPGAKVMPVEHYKVYSGAMSEIFDHVKSKRPWWKFWGKK